MKNQEELREYALHIASLLKLKYKTKRVFLIGSVITGLIHERSDIDIVVEGLPLTAYMKALTEAYDVLPPGIELNLIPYEDAFETLKEKTIKEGELLYGYDQVA